MDEWPRWILVSVALLVVLMWFMYAIAAPWFEEIRHALGMPTFSDQRRKVAPPPPADDAELARLLVSGRAALTSAVGLGGIAIVTWLMVLKWF